MCRYDTRASLQKEYAHVKPVVINGGRWLSKEVEAKVQPTEEPMDDCIPEDQRNLMHIQYAPLVLDDEPVRTAKQSSRPKRSSLTSIVLDGKSFQKVTAERRTCASIDRSL